jgi:hypothetical protein
MVKMKQKIKNNKFLKIGAVLCLLALWTMLPFILNDKVEASSDSVVILTRNATLSAPGGGINPHGDATYELYQSGQRELEVEAEDVNLPDGTVLSTFIDGAHIGTFTLSRQKGKLKLKTENGQAVPVANDASPVEVRNGSTVLLTGFFGGGPAPSPSSSPSGSPTGSPSASPNPSASPSSSPTGTPSPSPSPSGTPNSGNLFAGFSGVTINGVLPVGYAELEVHSNRLELESRIRQVSLAAGTSLSVFVNNIAAGTMVLENGGEARLRLRSDHGDNIPAISNGSTIRINNGDTVILSGTFSGFTTPSPSPTASPSPGSTPSPSPSPSPALGRSFEANLTGAGIDPPVTTAGTGEFKVTLNTAETQATIFGEFHTLSSEQAGARIESTVGSATVVHDFGAVGGLNGNFASVTIDVNAAQVAQFRAGLVRAVITSASNPAGEIASVFRQQSNRSDFDGDGGNDFAVFRPSEGIWYIQNGQGFSAQIFGSASDKVVSSDFDGDGKTDWAMFTNSNGLGVWKIKRSSDTGITTTQFGLASDDPLRGDFDGDGRIDLAVFRPSNGVWYIQHSGNGSYRFVQFGMSGDKAIPSDMDGDGKDDLVVFRPSEGVWYWLNSSDGRFGAVQFGTAGDIPVVADMDGDGKQDITVYRPSQGVWYSLRSSTGAFVGMHFGLDGDIPVAGDYDKDGKADVAVYRPSDGNWYITRSSDGQYQVFRFGTSGDIPAIAH